MRGPRKLGMSSSEASGTIHASAVLVGRKAVLIRGASGAGKSRLAWALLEAGRTGVLAFARLVADDRAEIEVSHARLLVRPAAALGGLFEIRGIGICRLPYEPMAVAGTVIDLGADDAERLPLGPARTTLIQGIRLPRLPIAPGIDPLPLILAELAPAIAASRH
jgi:HPr kinase/phosphorylase